MNVYTYSGPVMMFETCVADNWKGETTAVTERKARSNLTYQYKSQNGLLPSARITLPGKIKRKDET